MTTVRPKGRSAPPTPFTDTRTVVIGLLALVASVSVAAAAVFAALATRHPDIPGIHFGIGCDHLLESMLAAGPKVLGLDWRTPIGDARRRMGLDLVVQGNLDPALVLAGAEVALMATEVVLDDNGCIDGERHPGHIFNLGHGVPPNADPGVLQAIVDRVKERTSR